MAENGSLGIKQQSLTYFEKWKRYLKIFFFFILCYIMDFITCYIIG